jgi:hypothetical protein
MNLSLLNFAYAQPGDLPPGCSFSGLVPNCPNGCGWFEFWCLVDNLFAFALKMTLVLAIVIIMYAGFLFITAGGKIESIKKAYAAVIAAVVGSAIVYGSNIVVDLVFKAVTGGSPLSQ